MWSVARVYHCFAGVLDHEQAFFFRQVLRGNQGQGLRHDLGGCVGRDVPTTAGVERDFDTGASAGQQVGCNKVLEIY